MARHATDRPRVQAAGERLTDTLVVVGIIINAALLVITAFAAWGTVVQARMAVAARGDAEKARDEAQRVATEATDALKRSAAALEKSNEMRETESRPPAWIGPTPAGGEMRSMTNNSGRTIKVERVEVEPKETADRVMLELAEDGIYKYGDSFDYMVVRVMGPRPRKITAYWRFLDEPDDELNEWIIALY